MPILKPQQISEQFFHFDSLQIQRLYFAFPTFFYRKNLAVTDCFPEQEKHFFLGDQTQTKLPNHPDLIQKEFFVVKGKVSEILNDLFFQPNRSNIP